MKTIARCFFLTAIIFSTLLTVPAFAHDPMHHGPTWAEQNNSRLMRMREFEARRDFRYGRAPLSNDPGGAAVPIDGGLVLLLVAGVGLGAWMVVRKGSKVQVADI